MTVIRCLKCSKETKNNVLFKEGEELGLGKIIKLNGTIKKYKCPNCGFEIVVAEDY